MNRVEALAQKLQDGRSRKIVFLSHCILNENVRYLGGAGRSSCVREIIEKCLDGNIGMVQMPCPEQRAWGGVLKRLLLQGYGLKERSSVAYHLRAILISLGVFYTRLIYRRMAGAVVDQIEDYITSGCTVVGIVGIDGSPSCGVTKTLDYQSAEDIASIPFDSITVEGQNNIVRENVISGTGLFSQELKNELKRRRIVIPYLAHDLIAELEGEKSKVDF